MVADPEERLQHELEDRQRNVLPHDQLRNSRGVDAFLWRGDPNATKVQRAGIVVFASFFLIAFIEFLGIAFESHSFLCGFISLMWFALALRLFRNALLHKTR